jgi:6-phosphogluconolactonase (cycloisomerase 2 family)
MPPRPLSALPANQQQVILVDLRRPARPAAAAAARRPNRGRHPPRLYIQTGEGSSSAILARAMSVRYAFVGSTSPGQHVVEDSPGFGRGSAATVRDGILPLRCHTDGTVEVGRLQEAAGPSSWIAHHPHNGHLYCTGKGGTVQAMSVDADDGSLSVFSSADSLGGSAFLELSADGRWALTANYGNGQMAVLPIDPADGTLGPAVDSKLHVVSGLNPALADRQEACHPHQIRLDPATNGWALSCDLGASRVWVYRFDTASGALQGALTSDRHLLLPEGAGPRHLDFHPSGRFVYVICELDGNIVACRWNSAEGRLQPIQSLYALADGAVCSRAHHSGCAHVLVNAAGTALYASARTTNEICVCSIDADGTLTKLQCVGTVSACLSRAHPPYAVLSRGNKHNALSECLWRPQSRSVGSARATFTLTRTGELLPIDGWLTYSSNGLLAASALTCAIGCVDTGSGGATCEWRTKIRRTS